MPETTGEDRLAAIQEELTGAVENMLASDDWRAALTAAARFHKYSFDNVLLIYLQHADAFAKGRVPVPEPSMVAGYRQWEAMGRHVLAGQHGYTILRPNRLQWRETKDPDSGEWRRLGRFEHAAAGAPERSRSRLHPNKPFGLATVFDVSQTDGDPIPEPPRPQLLAGRAPEGLWDGLAAQVAAEGFTLGDVGSAVEIGGANGVTNWQDMSVTIRSDMDDLARTKTLSHELGHVLMHDPRGEDGTVDLAEAIAVTRGAKEVEAESVAFLIGAAHGMDTTAYSLPYISTWASRDDGIATVRQVGTRAIATARSILAKLPTEQVGSGQPPGLQQRIEERRSQTRPLHDRTRHSSQERRRAASVRETVR
jgi:antirestriction protein ArdC